MNNIYLIPANTKKGQLILNLFKPFDLGLLLVGLATTFLLFVIIGNPEGIGTFLILIPGLVSAFLVLPIPNYHNVLQFFISFYGFLTNQRIFRWRGWCFYEYTDEKK